MQGYHLSKEGIQWVLFCEKWYITGKELDLGEEPRRDKTRQDNVLFGVLYSPMYIDFIQII